MVDVVEPLKVVVVPYDPAWPALFEGERRRLGEAFAEVRAVIEHVGSTSVPGLAAKPIIDVMVGLGRLADADARIGALGELGYEYVPEYEAELPDRRYFRRPHARPRLYHVHCVVEGSEFWRRHLAFRDLLRDDPTRAQAYGELKSRLADVHATERERYQEAKAPFIQRALAEVGFE